jgi:hypothetical protein
MGGIQGIALIFLCQHVEALASVLPRYPRDLSIIVVKIKGKDNTFKVRREKVLHALLWLLRNNQNQSTCLRITPYW